MFTPCHAPSPCSPPPHVAVLSEQIAAHGHARNVPAEEALS